jgi:pyridoxal phosphate enzyme (YggS family)
MSSFAERLAAVQARIASARARSAGAEVTLIAVSKTQPAEAVRALYDAGQRHFGENYAQELAKKVDALAGLEGAAFHFIGHLQKNKIKDVVGRVRSIQTVDTCELARAIDRRVSGVLDVLIEVNIAGEEQKAGVGLQALPALAEAIGKASRLRLMGLMTVPPASDDAEEARPHFRRLREAGEALLAAGLLPHGLALSMGMSHDFEVAIEEGATIVRVGTALSGPRPPTLSVDRGSNGAA